MVQPDLFTKEPLRFIEINSPIQPSRLLPTNEILCKGLVVSLLVISPKEVWWTTTRTSRCSSPSRRPCGALLSFRRELSFMYYASALLCTRHFVIIVINNIRTRFIISFYVICTVIYCSFYCIYVWLDPATYMIARFMSFYKPGVTGSYALGVCDPSCELWLSWVIHLHRLVCVSWLCFIFLNWAL